MTLFKATFNGDKPNEITIVLNDTTEHLLNENNNWEYESELNYVKLTGASGVENYNLTITDTIAEYTLITEEEKIQQEIATLKKQLTDTDYLVSRTFEQVMALDNPLTFVSDTIKILKEFREKYAETITNRETWRKRIEELENK